MLNYIAKDESVLKQLKDLAATIEQAKAASIPIDFTDLANITPLFDRKRCDELHKTVTGPDKDSQVRDKIEQEVVIWITSIGWQVHGASCFGTKLNALKALYWTASQYVDLADNRDDVCISSSLDYVNEVSTGVRDIAHMLDDEEIELVRLERNFVSRFRSIREIRDEDGAEVFPFL